MFDEIIDRLGFGGEICPQKYRYTVLGVNGGIFEGVKKVIEINDEEITLCVKGGILLVRGENLKITCFGEKEITIAGFIKGVELK